ncbi:hypothetical protein VSR69_32995 [Paraburkholderia phytofirmans]|uniref:hypothetical protein n=1 Tax=Paraburkholderia sp. BL9I2N2 TaxID=1938809 RepID=UPI00104886FC|nr:hypothetical protein [Paraburkholderia sp. BL9I2N2]
MARFSFLPAKEPANPESVVPTTMAEQENIDRFNKYASEAFAILYSFFPQGCNFGPHDFDIPKDEHGGVTDEDASFVSATIDWLKDEGYLRILSADMSGNVYGAVLTGKGLAVLKLIPDALTNPAPLGEQIQAAVKAGSVSVAKTLLNTALDAGIKYTMAHAGIPV